MDLEIDDSSAEAVYEQIVRQVQSGIRSGELPPGTALPSIRQLADDLALNHNTVAKAYKILEANRVILTAGRRGTFIHADAAAHIASRNGQDAVFMMEEAITALSGKGLTLDQIHEAFDTALKSKKRSMHSR